MVAEKDPEFLIQTKDMTTVIDRLMSDIPSTRAIMLDRIVKRTLYKVPLRSGDTGEKSRWIRIMDGDAECDGQPKCTITYKDKMKNMSDEEKAVLKVDNYDDAIHLFDLLHYERVSYQENLRSKFVCNLDDVKYVIRFDIWPKIEDVTFVTVIATSSADNYSLSDFVDALGLEELNIWSQPRVDVDKVYEDRFHCPAMFIPEVTFDFDLQIPKRS
jgi:hypothetical protein